MSKSLYVVGGIGTVGCLMLSLMMQHLLKVKKDRAVSPVAIELARDFEAHLAGPIEVRTLEEDGEPTMVVRLPVQPGARLAELAKAAGDFVWRRAYLLPELPGRLRVEAFPVDGSEPVAAAVSRPPALDRLHAGVGPGSSPGATGPAAAPRTPAPSPPRPAK